MIESNTIPKRSEKLVYRRENVKSRNKNAFKITLLHELNSF